jgi:hypothetical protein
MKRLYSKARAAFTLTEMMVTTIVAALVGYTGYTILHVGLMLFAKNSAINVSHQQARKALLRMENDFHASTSQVQLTDSAGALLPTSAGPEAGISFQVLRGGPFIVSANASQGTSKVTANFGATPPQPQQRLIIPLHRVEADIVSVSGSGPEYTVTLDQPLRRDIRTTLTDASGGAIPARVQSFLTERVFYAVSSGSLTRAEATQSTRKIIASGVVANTPFRLAPGSSGTFDRKMVTALDLSTRDTGTSALGFKSANILLNASVPVRYRLAENL